MKSTPVANPLELSTASLRCETTQNDYRASDANGRCFAVSSLLGRAYCDYMRLESIPLKAFLLGAPADLLSQRQILDCRYRCRCRCRLHPSNASRQSARAFREAYPYQLVWNTLRAPNWISRHGLP